MSEKEIADPKVKYYHDERGKQYLAVDVEGFDLDRGGCLWVWVEKPEPVTPGRQGFSYPSFADANDCTPGNSIRVELAGRLERERGNMQRTERVWIPLRVPDEDLEDIRYLLLWTEHIDVPGWGWVPPQFAR